MANEKKINAIADAEQAGLYYSSNTEEGFTREIKGETHSFLDSEGKPVKGKRDLKRIEEMRIPPAWTEVWICKEKNGPARPPPYRPPEILAGEVCINI